MEHLINARDDADSMLANLRLANADAGPVTGLLVLDMIEAVATTRNKIASLIHAMESLDEFLARR